MKSSANEKEKSGTYALLSKIEEQAKNYETSLKYHRKFSALSFEEELKIKEHSVYEADQKYKNRELLYLVNESERRVRNIVTIWILSILAACGLSLAAIQTWRRRMTEKNAEIQEYRNKIRAMQEYSSFLEKIKDAVPEKNALIDKQIIALADMMDILVHSRENLKLTELMRFNKLMEQGKAEEPEMLEVFRNTFESRYPGVQEKLHHEFSLSRREIDLYILIIFECSASVIAYIFKTTEGYVYNLRARLRKKIALSDERMTFENHLEEMQNRQTI